MSKAKWRARTINLKSWSVVSALQSVWVLEFRTVPNMAQTILSSNADSVVLSHNGSVGVRRISVSLAIRSRLKEITYQGKRRVSYLNVRVQQIVLLK